MPSILLPYARQALAFQIAIAIQRGNATSSSKRSSAPSAPRKHLRLQLTIATVGRQHCREKCCVLNEAGTRPFLNMHCIKQPVNNLRQCTQVKLPTQKGQIYGRTVARSSPKLMSDKYSALAGGPVSAGPVIAAPAAAVIAAAPAVIAPAVAGVGNVQGGGQLQQGGPGQAGGRAERCMQPFADHPLRCVRCTCPLTHAVCSTLAEPKPH
jgi:hypothetical protein